jgi:tripartite-type tricarboxylate transporter receptor subunit TctC
LWKRLICIAILAHVNVAVWAASGNADPYPNRQIRIIDGFAAGGNTDYMARVIGAKLAERLGQPVVVENHPGAAGNIGAEMVARANPDGYTLFIGNSLNMSASRSLYPQLGYDFLKDFVYVSRVATAAQVLVVPATLPANTLSEFVDLARSKPKAMSYGSSGVASPGHLFMEVLQSRTGMELVHVPYKGGPPTIPALVRGEVQISALSAAAGLPMIEAKKLKVLAVTGATRMVALPAVPTVAESGFPGFDLVYTLGIIAPAGTPAAIVELLNAEIRSIVQMDDVKAKFATQGLEAVGSTPDEFRAVVEADYALWSRVIKESRITLN